MNILQSTGTTVTFQSNITPELYLYNHATAGDEPSWWSKFIVRSLQPTVKIRGPVNETIAPHGESRVDLSPAIMTALAIGGGLAVYGAWSLIQLTR